MNKYFIAFAFTDQYNIPRFGNGFYESNDEITDSKALQTITSDIRNKHDIEDVIVINFFKLN